MPKHTDGIESIGGHQKRHGAIQSYWNVQFILKYIEIVQTIGRIYNLIITGGIFQLEIGSVLNTSTQLAKVLLRAEKRYRRQRNWEEIPVARYDCENVSPTVIG